LRRMPRRDEHAFGGAHQSRMTRHGSNEVELTELVAERLGEVELTHLAWRGQQELGDVDRHHLTFIAQSVTLTLPYPRGGGSYGQTRSETASGVDRDSSSCMPRSTV
jgi:hypothetical protein